MLASLGTKISYSFHNKAIKSVGLKFQLVLLLSKVVYNGIHAIGHVSMVTEVTSDVIFSVFFLYYSRKIISYFLSYFQRAYLRHQETLENIVRNVTCRQTGISGIVISDSYLIL